MAPKLLYIGPCGYSGSTALDLALAQHEDITSGGELCFLGTWLTENHRCTCRAPIESCPWWTAVSARVDRAALVGESPGRLAVLGAVIGLAPCRRVITEAGRRMWEVVDAASDVSGCPMVVDSSKRLSRLACLASARPGEVVFLHLRRPLRQVIESSSVQKARPAMAGAPPTVTRSPLRTAVMWSARNLGAVVVARRFGIRRRPVRHADLMTAPACTMETLCSWLGVGYRSRMLILGTGDSHNISGSRWRFGPTRVLGRVDPVPRT